MAAGAASFHAFVPPVRATDDDDERWQSFSAAEQAKRCRLCFGVVVVAFTVCPSCLRVKNVVACSHPPERFVRICGTCVTEMGRTLGTIPVKVKVSPPPGTEISWVNRQAGKDV